MLISTNPFYYMHGNGSSNLIDVRCKSIENIYIFSIEDRSNDLLKWRMVADLRAPDVQLARQPKKVLRWVRLCCAFSEHVYYNDQSIDCVLAWINMALTA